MDTYVKEICETQRGSKQPAGQSLAASTMVTVHIEPVVAVAAVPHAPEQTQKGHIMIFYCWASKKVVKKVQTALVQMGVKVWFDEDEMHGSLIDRMAEAIEGSQAIVLCYSQNYKNSGNCRGEAQYAYKCKKPIIPVRCQGCYDADEWLGFIIGSMPYYDLAIGDSFNQNLPCLLKEVARSVGSKYF